MINVLRTRGSRQHTTNRRKWKNYQELSSGGGANPFADLADDSCRDTPTSQKDWVAKTQDGCTEIARRLIGFGKHLSHWSSTMQKICMAMLYYSGCISQGRCPRHIFFYDPEYVRSMSRITTKTAHP
jgi:hypothetical protein